MNKIYVLISLISFPIFNAQKCDNLTQHIDSRGHFNISLNTNLDNQKFETPVEMIEINDDKNSILLDLFQKKFPEIYDGKCLRINTKDTTINEFFFCDKIQKDNIPEYRFKTLGTFNLVHIFDDYYFFKYSGFEIGGYFMYNARDHFFYSFNGKLVISKDKNIIYSYTSSPYFGFSLNILQLDYYRELNYGLRGNFDVIELKLTKYNGSEKYSFSIDLNEKREVRNENYEIVKSELCNRKISIN